MMSLLTIQELCVQLCSGNHLVKAVDHLSLQIERGETFCLVGESGSGKSITALSVIGLLPTHALAHLSGKITLQTTEQTNEKPQDAIDLLQLDEKQLRQIRGFRIAMIFQDPMSSLNPVLTIGEQITEALQLHHPDMSDSVAREKTLRALRDVQMPKPEQRLSSYPHQLSGGQRQRVMIAMALACEPDLLIADEPTTALDVTVQAEILQLMRNLQQRKGMSILFITHDFGVVAQMAHKVGVMQAGKLVEVNPTQTLLQQPKHTYTQKLLAALPENLNKHQTYTPPNNDILVDIQALDVWFPIKKGLLRRTVDYVKAVDHVDLQIKKGRIVALVGESGSGKTTLGRATLQLQKSTSGKVLVDHTDLTTLSDRQLRPWRQRLQIAFQDPQSSLNPRLQIATALTEPMAVHGIGESHDERIALAEETLRQVHLDPEFLWRYPHEFSGGQRQRIGLARALVLAPEFIVCDEITSALDVSVQAEILQLLLEIRANRELTLLFITHNIGVVEYLSDETVVMYQGKIVEQGKTDAVCGNPQDPYTQRLLSAVPRL
ncbi:MAG: ABC transporter ATP-binding protein [bacterium]